ncbi:UbiA prenyltransferase family-domain-containing protein [Mycena leptocephala]|nr:UbiA prenyltransferase family-domain-containing protein [Mycena leptocephala]
MLTSKPSGYSSTISGYADLIRLKEPEGMVLVFMPFGSIAYSLALSAYAKNMPISEVLGFSALFAFWAFIGHSMGCTVNDICDRDIDARVVRTKARPLPSGRVSVLGAKTFLVIQILIFMGVFYPMKNDIIMGYPWMKRVTNWPQAWLGVTLFSKRPGKANWGAVIGWISVNERLDPVVGCLMCGLFASGWILLIFRDLDTIYALQDRVDDAKLGVGSSALATSSNTHLFLSLCAATFVICLTAVGILNQQGLTFFVVTIGGASLELCSQLLVLNVDQPQTYAGVLARNSRLGPLICAVTDLGWVRQRKLLRNSGLVRHLTPPPHTSHSLAGRNAVNTVSDATVRAAGVRGGGWTLSWTVGPGGDVGVGRHLGDEGVWAMPPPMRQAKHRWGWDRSRGSNGDALEVREHLVAGENAEGG